MNKLIAYKCLECGHYTISKHDGVKCSECGGALFPTGNATNADKPKGLIVNVSMKDTDIFKRMMDVFLAIMDDQHTPQLIKDKIQSIVLAESEKE